MWIWTRIKEISFAGISFLGFYEYIYGRDGKKGWRLCTFFKSENAKRWPIWAILWRIFRTFWFYGYIHSHCSTERKDGHLIGFLFSWRWNILLWTTMKREILERLLSCSRVSSSAGFMDGEEEILELLFPCRENSFSSALHCLWIPRPSPPPPRQWPFLSWDATAVEFFNGQVRFQIVEFPHQYLYWNLDACQGLWKEPYPVLPPVVL